MEDEHQARNEDAAHKQYFQDPLPFYGLDVTGQENGRRNKRDNDDPRAGIPSK